MTLMLCYKSLLKIKSTFNNQVIAVSQVINKHGHGKINHTFTAEDEKVLKKRFSAGLCKTKSLFET